MSNMYKYLVLILVILLASCSDESVPIEELDIPLSEKIKLSLDEDGLYDLGLEDEHIDYLKEYNELIGYKNNFINDSLVLEESSKLLFELKHAEYYGMPQKRYAFIKDDSLGLLQTEQIINLRLSLICHDIKFGILDTAAKQERGLGLLSANELNKLISTKDTSSWFDHILKTYSPHQEYTYLAKGLHDYVSTFALDTSQHKIESMREDSIATYKLTKTALVKKGYLASEKEPDSIFLKQLKLYQQHNGLLNDGIVGTYTAISLNESTDHKVRRAILALEKWRWKDSLPNEYIWVNIPAYELKLFMNDSLIRTHRVVVGKNDTRTPEFTAKMRTIVAYPFWHLPYSISSEEILPQVKKNVGYLAEKGYKIFRDGAEINPDSVNWASIRQTNFPFRVRQNGGNSNSLGIVKMLFPNKHAVYIHDTPSKRFFQADVRSYSHGCIRCENPVDLAKEILKRDNNLSIPDSLDTFIARKTEQHIALRNPFPVYIDYISVGTNQNKELNFYVDIYSKDNKYLKMIYREEKE